MRTVPPGRVEPPLGVSYSGRGRWLGMDAPRRLSEFLQQAADQSGDPGLFEGAIVFVALNRPLDRLIQHTLAAGDYHRGTPSPWSHVFLLAERYHGPTTSIVECSVRSKGRPLGR